MKEKGLGILAVLLIFSICTSLLPASVLAVPAEEPAGEKTPTMVDFIAGTATAEDIYGVLDPSIVPAAIDYNEAVEKNHIARCYEDEGTDLNKIIFLNIDGTKTMYTFDFPVKYVDDNGNIQDIRLEIADSTVNAGEFQTAANDTVTTFAARFTDGIALEGNDTEIRLIPILPLADLAMTMSTTDIAAPTATAQRIDADTVAYPYDAKTTVEYSLTYTGFKEDIVVSEYTGQTTYPFRLLTNGLALEEINGSFFLVDDQGNIEASIGDIIIFTADERNNAFGDIEPKTIIENQEYLLNIVVDADYLADPTTTYPIRIDPTIEINYNNNGASAIEDITISTNKNYSGSHNSLYVGRRSTEGIARALMRFPGLNLSNLAGATVTSATVQLRDLMCESDELAISCHVFTGNVWDANSATWSNVSPNSYVSTAMSANTVSWAIGKTHSPVHWYSFDISPAVQGWIDGNYTQNKGIIFKVADSVENGSAIKNRTFGSYNRSSYRPSLTVNYTEPGTQFLANDTYYLNNRGTGKYLQLSTSGTANGVSGLLSDLGNRIQWQLQKVGSGYVIRSVNDPTKYLAGAASSSSASVSITTVSDSAIPQTCIWSISAASLGGCLIRNAASGNYLYSSGSYLYTSSSTGSYGSATYELYVWRMPPLSFYGTTASHDVRELESGFSIADLIVNIGESRKPSVRSVPSNAAWAYSSDFTFTRSSGTSGCVSITGLDNTFNGLAVGIATYTATHKVTGRTTTFKVFVDRYTYVLETEFGFDDSNALLIRNVYDKVDAAYPNESAIMRAWRASRILGGIWYDYDGGVKAEVWKTVAGNVCTEEQQYFTDILGFSVSHYQAIQTAIRNNHNGDTTSDFAHMQIALAGRLAWLAGQNGTLTEYAVIWTAEGVSHLCGWLGDAVLPESNGTTAIGNGDYHADLDAENIYCRIARGATLVNATNAYYESLTSTYTRATEFLNNINYEVVKEAIYYGLIDWELMVLLGAAQESGLTEEEISLIETRLADEQYHIDVIRQNYRDTYNFMCSLQDELGDIEEY